MNKGRKFSKRNCIAYGCLNSNRVIPDLSLFSLPRDPIRRRKWLTLIGRMDLVNKEDIKYKSHEVCSKHFNDCDMKTIRLLRPDALPKNVRLRDEIVLEDTSGSEDSGDESSPYVQMLSSISEPASYSIGIQTEGPASSKTALEILLADEPPDKPPQKRKLQEDLDD